MRATPGAASPGRGCSSLRATISASAWRVSDCTFTWGRWSRPGETTTSEKVSSRWGRAPGARGGGQAVLQPPPRGDGAGGGGGARAGRAARRAAAVPERRGQRHHRHRRAAPQPPARPPHGPGFAARAGAVVTMMDRGSGRVLVIDDDPSLRFALEAVLGDARLAVEACPGRAARLQALQGPGAGAVL